MYMSIGRQWASVIYYLVALVVETLRGVDSGQQVQIDNAQT